MTRRIAFKRLSAVEVDPARSHQHEFNATRLRRELGLADEITAGELSVTVYRSDEPEDVVVDRGRFTLYDSRKGKPDRSAEYRLYYDTSAITEASEGDLLVLYGDGPDALSAIVARGGTRLERDLSRALMAGDDLSRFRIVDDPALQGDLTGDVAQATVAQPAVPATYPELAAGFIEQAASSGVIPGSGVMATAAQDAVLRGYGVLEPDLQLYQALEAETDIYFALEERIKGARVPALYARGASLTELLSFAMSVQQSRKSRRGQSLQNHFAYILDREGISYSPQCETEPGERPDFVFPDCPRYHDPAFPKERLRMVACKTTAKERWRQVLNEAVRVPIKYILTVDTGLTPDTLRAMAAAELRVFAPAPIIASTYPAASLGTVRELIGSLPTTS